MVSEVRGQKGAWEREFAAPAPASGTTKKRLRYAQAITPSPQTGIIIRGVVRTVSGAVGAEMTGPEGPADKRLRKRQGTNRFTEMITIESGFIFQEIALGMLFVNRPIEFVGHFLGFAVKLLGTHE